MQYFYITLIHCLSVLLLPRQLSHPFHIYLYCSYHFCIDQKFIGLARNVSNAVEPFSSHCLISNLCIANLTFEACLLMNYVTLYRGGRGERVDDKPLACERQNQSEMQIKTNPTQSSQSFPTICTLHANPRQRYSSVCVRVCLCIVC